jgi:hypothetical protein
MVWTNNRLAEASIESGRADLTQQTLPKLKDITEPLLEELKQWPPKQWEIYKERKGQVHDVPE